MFVTTSRYPQGSEITSHNFQGLKMFRLLKILATRENGDVMDDGFRLINDDAELIFRRNFEFNFISVTIHADQRKLTFRIPGRFVDVILSAMNNADFEPCTNDVSSDRTVFNDKETSVFYLTSLKESK